MKKIINVYNLSKFNEKTIVNNDCFIFQCRTKHIECWIKFSKRNSKNSTFLSLRVLFLYLFYTKLGIPP